MKILYIFQYFFILIVVFNTSCLLSFNHTWNWWFGTQMKRDVGFVVFEPCTTTEVLTNIHTVCAQLQLGSFSTSCCIKAGENIFNVLKGVPEKHVGDLIVYIPGYTGLFANGPHRFAGSAVHQLYYWCKNNLIKNTCVCCCVPPHLRTIFDFGQKNDQAYIHDCIDEITQKNPQVRIILMGPCHGATAILNYLTNDDYIKSDQIKAVVLESPSISLEAFAQRTATYHVPFGLRWMLYPLFRVLFSGYAWGQKTILDKEITLPNNLPIFVGSLKYDDSVNNEHVRAIVEKLQQISINKDLICFYESERKDLSHGKLGMDSEYQEKVHLFLENYSEYII